MDEINYEEEQKRIREEVSQMSFEELQKLQETLGKRVFNEKVLNVTKKVKKVEKYHRDTRNRPREMSSKIPPPRINLDNVKKKQNRDPRFDPLCGHFDSTVFNKAYKFVDEIKTKEYKALKKELTKTEDPKRIAKIKFLIQRMENQAREKERLEKESLREKEERDEQIAALKEGRRPRYQRNPEKKMNKIVAQYEELKQSGKLKKYIQKKRKINARKDMFKMDV